MVLELDPVRGIARVEPGTILDDLRNSAERHHLRSQRFFVGMLAAQLGVIASTFAMAARKRSLLWSFAAAAGVAAISFAVYVYLFV